MICKHATPRELNIAKDLWRPEQYEAVTWMQETKLAPDGQPYVKIAEMPTGSGKSVCAMALNDGTSDKQQVIALTHTRSLQHQYAGDFKDCRIQYGKSNYPCDHPKHPLPHATAEECLYRDDLHGCTLFNAGMCAYYASRKLSVAAPRVALNYAYWLTSQHIYQPRWLVLDEAHSLSDLVLEHIGATITARDGIKWQLPVMPHIEPPELAMFTGAAKAQDAVMHWLSLASAMMEQHAKHAAHGLKHASPKRAQELAQRLQQAGALHRKLAAIATALLVNAGEHWFIRSDDAGLTIRPLTARYDFKRFFLNQRAADGSPTRPILMSATIGKFEIFAQELGIEHWEGRMVANQWPVKSRPVYVLDAPGMGRRNTMKDELAFDKQADVIAKAILEQPHDWCGFILVSRKSETLELAKRLAKRGLAERVFPIVGENLSYMPTDQQLQMWEKRKQVVPNAIGISASFWEGIDGKREKILIAAKVPYGFLGDPYERARMHYDMATFHWRAASTMEQGLGRTRRGNPEDYDTAEQQHGFVAIADGDFARIKSYLSKNILEAIREL